MNFLYLQLITKQQLLSGSEQIILKWRTVRWQRGCLSQWPFNRINLFLLYVLLNWWAASKELLTVYGLFFQRNGQYHKLRLNSLSNRNGKYATLSCGCRANTVLQWCSCVAVTSNTSDDERKGFLILLHARLVAILSRLFFVSYAWGTKMWCTDASEVSKETFRELGCNLLRPNSIISSRFWIYDVHWKSDT